MHACLCTCVLVCVCACVCACVCVCVCVCVYVCVCGGGGVEQAEADHVAVSKINKILHPTQASLLLQQHPEVGAAVTRAVVIGAELLLQDTILVLDVVVNPSSGILSIWHRA